MVAEPDSARSFVVRKATILLVPQVWVRVDLPEWSA
jgi:hypothetical protein